MMQLRPYVIEDYETLKKWWEAHGWPPVNQHLLPVVNAIAYEKESGRMYAAGFCYLGASRPIAMVEWLVTNPDNTPRESYAALNNIVMNLTATVKRLGYSIIFTSSNNDALVRIYEKHGFQKTDSGMTHLIADLKEEI